MPGRPNRRWTPWRSAARLQAIELQLAEAARPPKPRPPRRRDLPRCGARCRSKGGEPCGARVVVRADGSLSKRCRMHGGCSTGPRTAEGKARAAAAARARLLARWAAWRAARAPQVQP